MIGAVLSIDCENSQVLRAFVIMATTLSPRRRPAAAACSSYLRRAILTFTARLVLPVVSLAFF